MPYADIETEKIVWSKNKQDYIKVETTRVIIVWTKEELMEMMNEQRATNQTMAEEDSSTLNKS